jgi:RNA polymerase sigma factor (sigma-70 family)
VEPLEALVDRAQNGDREALEGVVVSIRGRIHALALRMLWNPEDANDATQEILVRIVTRLATFRGESAFTTWVYRVAANHLLTVRKSRLEEQRYTFERFAGELDEGLSDVSDEAQAGGPARDLLLQEVRVGCTLGMLQCLDRPHRLAYILGEILELEGDEAARVLGIRPAAFRKRLSRARDAVIAFTRAKCGLVEPERPCRCRRRLPAALRLGRVEPDRLRFASSGESAATFPDALAEIRRLHQLRRVAALFRAQPPSPEPASLVAFLRALVVDEAPPH